MTTASGRTRFLLQIGTLSSLIGVVLIFPFRVPPIQRIEGPVLGFLFPLLWTLANAWPMREVQPTVDESIQKVNWILVSALAGLLAIFQLVLAPGVHFF